jgi:hypothetical protein
MTVRFRIRMKALASETEIRPAAAAMPTILDEDSSRSAAGAAAKAAPGISAVAAQSALRVRPVRVFRDGIASPSVCAAMSTIPDFIRQSPLFRQIVF